MACQMQLNSQAIAQLPAFTIKALDFAIWFPDVSDESIRKIIDCLRMFFDADVLPIDQSNDPVVVRPCRQPCSAVGPSAQGYKDPSFPKPSRIES